jgi:TPR repeat protein
MYSEGLGIPQNLPEAIRLYEVAAAAGEFLAQVELGRIYSRGLGVTADPAAAQRWYSTAVAHDNTVLDGEALREAKAYLEAHP